MPVTPRPSRGPHQRPSTMSLEHGYCGRARRCTGGPHRASFEPPRLIRLKLFLLKGKMAIMSKAAVTGAVGKAQALAVDGARYVAYSSDVGESMRPATRPRQANPRRKVRKGAVTAHITVPRRSFYTVPYTVP
ncbi:hypothetical protein M885DRAFT_160519 [Pelagophyceae sp. CCMP2097]|nr:hypothetical protein M885DRAFT_160519 [Pelagophyceae sp. CCMP2097]